MRRKMMMMMTMKNKLHLAIKRFFYKKIPVQVLDANGEFICYTWAWVRK